MKLLRALVVFVALAATPSCATMVSGIATVRSVVDTAALVIDAIDGFAHSYFTQHPDPVKQAAVELRVAQTRAAAAFVRQAAEGAQDLHDKRVTEAFAAFQEAYAQLIALGQSFGVQPASDMSRTKMAAASGVLVVPAELKLAP